VVLETKNLFRKEVEKYVTSVKKLGNLVPSIANSVSIPDIEEICNKYEEALNLRLAELDVEILTHADIPHTNIVSRVLASRKPFRESGKGYRDALLWEVILRKVANSTQTTFFITNNHEDFGHKKDKEGQLHSHLVEDLTAAGHPPDCVHLYTNLKIFVDKEIAPHLEQLEYITEAIENLRQGEYRSFSIFNWFIESRDKFINSANNWIAPLLSNYPGLESPEVSYIEAPEEVRVEDVLTFEDDKVYVDAVALAEVIVDVFIFKPDYYWLSDRYPLGIMDDDWNEHYMWAQITLQLPINFSLVFNITDEQVEEFEVNPVEDLFGWCSSCGAAILSDAAETCSRCGKSLI
jgi:hypothetical protein